MCSYHMSNLIGGIGGWGNSGVLTASDDRAMPIFHRWAHPDRTAMRPWDDGILWSTPAFLGGSSGWALSQDAMTSGCYDSYGPDERGGQQTKKLTGITRDSSAIPAGSCNVMGFVTTTNVFVGQVTSDSGGYYELPTAYAGVAHFLVVYRAGSPDIAGTTLNTLIPV